MTRLAVERHRRSRPRHGPHQARDPRRRPVPRRCQPHLVAGRPPDCLCAADLRALSLPPGCGRSERARYEGCCRAGERTPTSQRGLLTAARLVVTTSKDEERSLAQLDLLKGRGRALEPEGGEEEEEVESPNNPDFSPDGRSIAFTAETPGERTHIFLLDLVTSKLREIENDADHNDYPAFSPTAVKSRFRKQTLGSAGTSARCGWTAAIRSA